MPLKSTQKGIAHLFVLVVLVGTVIAALTVVYLQLVRKDTASKSQAKTVTQPRQVMADIKAQVSRQYKLKTMSDDGTKSVSIPAGYVGVSEGTSSSAYKVPGYAFYTFALDGASLHMSPHGWDNYTRTSLLQSTLDIRKDIVTVFTDRGLKAVTASRQTEVQYENATMVCSADNKDTLNNQINVMCATKQSFVAVARKAQPFFAVVPAKWKSDKISFSIDKIEKSKTPGYETASGGIGDMESGAAVLFYRKTESDWKFFTITQSNLACSDFNTVDLRSAFSGQGCTTKNGTLGTVTP